jgi:hypothetical protein
MSILRKLFNDYIYLNFNLVNTKFIEGNGVAYGLSYQDNSSEVQLIISPTYQSNKSVIHSTGRSIANELKDQLSLSLLRNAAEVDEVGITFPEEGINEKGEKYIKGFSFNTYEVKHSVNTSSVEGLIAVKLQKNISNSNFANIGNSYSDSQAVTLDNGDVVVFAKNLKDETLVSWYLKSDKKGKFKALAGRKGVTERKLFKLDNPNNQLVLNRETILYLQINRRIIENQEVVTTNIFAFHPDEIVQNLKNGKGVDEYLLGNKRGQINKKTFFSSEYEISFLQYVERGESDIVAFLEKDQLSNTQRLHLLDFNKGELLLDFPIYEFKDPIDQLYVKDNNQGGFTITAVSGENMITFNRNSFEESPSIKIIPANSIKFLRDLVAIIHGQLPGIISSSTVVPITTNRESAVTDESTTQATSTSHMFSSSSQSSRSITEKTSTASTITIKPIETTVIDEGYSSSTESLTTHPTTSEKSTVKSTTFTAPTTTVIPQVTRRITISTNAPIQTVFTIPSVSEILTGRPTPTMLTTTTMLPQSTSLPEPHKLTMAGAGGSSSTGIVAGAFFGVAGFIALTAFGVYKYVQRHRRNNAEPQLTLDPDVRYRSLHSGTSDSDEELSTNGAGSGGNMPLRNVLERSQPETELDSVSVTSDNSRASSESPGSSRRSSRS